MTSPQATYLRPKWLPLPKRSSIQMARVLWDDLEPFVNTLPPKAGVEVRDLELLRVHQRMRSLLSELKEGRVPFEGKPIAAAPLARVATRAGSFAWYLRRVRGGLDGSAEDIGAQCRFLLGLVALPEVRRLLKLCPRCHYTFILKRDVRQDKKTATRPEYCSACREPAHREGNTRRQRESRKREKAGRPKPAVRLLLRECANCGKLFRVPHRATQRLKEDVKDYCPACGKRVSREGKRNRASERGRSQA